MKRALVCAVLLLVAIAAPTVRAASTYAYTSTTFAYDTPSAGATALAWHASGAAPGCTAYPNGDDDFSDIVFPGGFSFTYGSVNYTGVRVYSNGILVFGTDTSGFHRTYTNTALPVGAGGARAGCTNGQPVNMMMVYWDDIVADPAGGGAATAAVKYELLGTAPNRRFVISWVNVNLYSTATTYNFQVALYESTAGSNGNFIYQYTNGSSTGSSATVGVQLTTTDYTQYAFNQAFIDTTIGTAILWYPANQLAAKGAEYRFDESSWTGVAGEIKDTSGAAQHASRTTANVTNVAGGKLCRGGTFTNNTLNTTIDAVATPIVPANQGSVDFWYKSTAAWNVADTMLLDATTVAAKPFFLMKMSTGALKFVITDSAGATYTAQTTAGSATAAGTWVHIGISWYVKTGTNQTVQQIMVNGVLQTTNTTTPFRSTSSGAIAAFSTLYIGDNRTSGVTPAGGTPNGANGTIDEVYIYSTEINATQEGADAALTRPTCTTLDHFHIVHAGSIVNCGGAGANITVEAHDVNHALFSLAGTVLQMATSTGNGTWSSVTTINPVNNTGGGTGNYTFANENTVIFGLQDAVFETLNINLNSGGITEKTGAAAVCVAQDYTVGVTCDANLTFSQAGFIFAAAANGVSATIPTQVAGTTSGTFYLRAVQATTSTAACTAAMMGANTVNFAYECNDPTTCSSSNLMTITGSAATTIQRNNNGAALSYVSVPMTFDASGNAPFTLNFADVGKTTLWVSKTIAPTTFTGTSGNFVTKPYSFTMSAIKTTATSFANPAAANSGGTVFIKAGDAFTVTVTANAFSGASPLPAAPNYGKEVTPETVKLTAALVGGLGLTNIPALNNSTAFAAFTNGVATGTTFSWDEVGIITLTPSVGDASYLGVGDVTGSTTPTGAATPNVGRFIPYKFGITAGGVTHACTAVTPFTYFGQDGFSTAFTITAQNAANATLQNYAGGFAKLPLTAFAGFGFGTTGLPVGSTYAASATLPTGVWGTVGGLPSPGAASVVAKHQVSRPTAPTAGTSVTVTALPADSDAVTLSPATAVAVSGAASPLLFGRLRVPNGAGSQLRNVTLVLNTQYYNGSGYVTNTDDSCTPFPASSAFSFGNFRKTLTAADPVIFSAPATFANGVAKLILQKPGGTRTGTYDMAISLNTTADTSCLQVWAPSIAATTSASLAYLQSNWCGATFVKDPAARISFGVYRGANNFVYQRENF